mgnify:CR=1 FL=1
MFEGLIRHLFTQVKGIELGEVSRMTYEHAMKYYGSDKPDLRFDSKIIDLIGTNKQPFCSVTSLVNHCPLSINLVVVFNCFVFKYSTTLNDLLFFVPEYHKLKHKYQLMWEQKDCDGYLKTAAVIAAYVDQSISTNTFYNPAHFPDRKVPTTLIAKNLMQSHAWGLKTFYYSLINKQGSKAVDEVAPTGQLEYIDFDDEEGCESCKL